MIAIPRLVRKKRAMLSRKAGGKRPDDDRRVRERIKGRGMVRENESETGRNAA
jgi:hypothetical protein